MKKTTAKKTKLKKTKKTKTKKADAYHQMIYNLSEKLVATQRPIRLLDAIKWDDKIKEDFFKAKFKKLPAVDANYYQKNALPFDPAKKNEEFYEIEREVRSHLGQFSAVGNIMQRMCREYRELVRMIALRGQPEFSKLSQELYGCSDDVFYAGAPSLKDLAEIISTALENIKGHTLSALDEKRYSSEEAVAILQERFSHYFHASEVKIRVKLSDGIIADAAAGADFIKIRRGARFSDRDLRIFEVHEGWVHMATTLNGMAQPVCTFLSKGPPSSTITQEGLAIIMEIFTFASYPGRVRRLTDRISAIHIGEQGGNFIDVFNFFLERNYSEEESYSNSVRVFRGSTPTNGPFTKDLTYSKGFVLIYNFIRLAIARGLIDRIPLLFTGKTTLEDLPVLADLVEEGIVVAPKFVPPQFADLAALSAWMCYSNFFNRIDLTRMAQDYKELLQR